MPSCMRQGKTLNEKYFQSFSPLYKSRSSKRLVFAKQEMIEMEERETEGRGNLFCKIKPKNDRSTGRNEELG